jgi:hypothetical protein
MKEFKSIITWSAVFALIMVSSIAARYVSIPPDSVLDKIITGMEPSKEFMYLLLLGLIFFLIGTFIRTIRR